MKKLIIFLLFFNFLSLFAQDKDVLIYKSYEDFRNNVTENLGPYETYITGVFGSAFTFTKKKGEKTYFKMKKTYWGFRIGGYIFRTYKLDQTKPLLVLKYKEKVFYMHGEFALSDLRNLSGTVYGHYGIFYSDNYTSQVHHIARIVNKEKKNKSLSSLCECIKEQKKRFDDQARFNGYSDCVEAFGEDLLENPEDILDEGF